MRVATDLLFGSWVEACGLRALPAGRSQAEMVAATAGLTPEERSIRQFTTVWVPTFAREVLASLNAWRPDLVVSEEGEHAGPLIAAVLGVPVVTHSWPAPARALETRAALTGALDDVWSAFGHVPPARMWGDHYLDCCPPPLQTSDIATIAGVIAVRPSPFDGPPVAPPPWIEDLVRPVVLVTLGTVSLFARPGVLRRIVDAVRSLAGTVVAATGPFPETVVPPHPGVVVARYVPLSAILPVSDLVVSHGGASTSAACLLAAVPQLVIPQGAPSQRRVAAAVVRSGIGSSIDPDPLQSEALAASARELLGDSNVRDHIDTALSTLDALPEPEEVAAYLAQL
ncbi:MAG: glycosyltransferase [Actinomycetota bacterium]|nr:glycosyltransferase [Actinomycetota bacterium]